jgi:WD40 repeat protein
MPVVGGGVHRRSLTDISSLISPSQAPAGKRSSGYPASADRLGPVGVTPLEETMDMLKSSESGSRRFDRTQLFIHTCARGLGRSWPLLGVKDGSVWWRAALLAGFSCLAVNRPAAAQPRETWEAPCPIVRQLAFSPDGKTVAVLNVDLISDGVTLLDAGTGKPTATLKSDQTRAGLLIVFTPDGERLVVVGERPLTNEEQKRGQTTALSTKVWNLAEKKVALTIDFPPGEGSNDWVVSDGKVLIVPFGEKNAGASIYSVATGKEIGSIDCPKGGCCLALSPDAKTLAVGYRNGSIALCDLEKREVRLTIQAPDKLVNLLAFSPDGGTLASNSSGGSSFNSKADLWDVDSAKRKGALDFGGDFFRQILYSPDGKSIAVAAVGKMLPLWDVAAGGARADFGDEDNPVNLFCVAFSPDGKTLVAAGIGKKIQVWDVPQEKPKGLRQHP